MTGVLTGLLALVAGVLVGRWVHGCVLRRTWLPVGVTTAAVVVVLALVGAGTLRIAWAWLPAAYLVTLFLAPRLRPAAERWRASRD